MPKHNQSLRKSTATKTKASKSAKYKSQRSVGSRTIRKPIAFCAGKASGDYLKPWLIPPAQRLKQQILAKRINKLVEKYGEIGAKWHLARTILNRDIPDATIADNFKAGKFFTFNGANTVDIIYIDTNATPNVYVLEAKGGKAGFSKGRNGKYPPNVNNHLSQGNFDYLFDVANAMANSSVPSKAAAGNAIIKAYNSNNGKLHYIGTSTKIGDSTTNPSPTELFNKTR
ncbi:MAG TPA: hypothetical protein P5032_11590 [Candidatus Competibacter sp.]|nr:hypothetical protein [Candidatus Competibacter sp.]